MISIPRVCQKSPRKSSVPALPLWSPVVEAKNPNHLSSTTTLYDSLGCMMIFQVQCFDLETSPYTNIYLYILILLDWRRICSILGHRDISLRVHPRGYGGYGHYITKKTYTTIPSVHSYVLNRNLETKRLIWFLGLPNWLTMIVELKPMETTEMSCTCDRSECCRECLDKIKEKRRQWMSPAARRQTRLQNYFEADGGNWVNWGHIV